MWNGYKVIDADAHMHEPRDLWDKYVEPKFRDQVPKVVGMNGVFFIYEDPKDPLKQFTPGIPWEEINEKYGEAYKTWWSPQSRLDAMDRHGWDIQVLLPTGNNGNFAYSMALKDAALGAAMCRAYNNWAHDYCSTNPKRLKFVALIPGSDAQELEGEMRRSVEKLGAVSVRNPLLPEGRWLHEGDYKRVWATACDLDIPIAVHGEYRHRRFEPFKATSGRDTDTDTKNMLSGLHHAIGFPFDNMTTMGHFIFSGLLERFPALRLGILESHAGWVPFWVGRMDDHTHGRNAVMGAVNKLRLRPSEYFRRQCFISCDSDETSLRPAVDYLNGDNLVRNTDYPHPDAPRPEQALPLFDAQGLSPQAKRKILWDNSVKLYGERIVS